MAAGVLLPPGSQHGPCAEPCEHTDCAATRWIAEFVCKCGKPIGYERAFYNVTPGYAAPTPEDRTYEHAYCDEDA